MELIHALHVPPGDGPFPTMIALHGWGAGAHDLLRLGPNLPGGFMTICPQGESTLPVAPGVTGYGWFALVPGQPPDARSFLRASGRLRAFVEEAVERYPVDRLRLYVLGFSQGGVMAYDLALRAPELFAGAVAVSTWLPEPLAANLPRKPAQQGFPVLTIHGTEDPQVDVALARRTSATLAPFGVDHSYQEFPMGHDVRPEALRAINRWLDAPRRAPRSGSAVN